MSLDKILQKKGNPRLKTLIVVVTYVDIRSFFSDFDKILIIIKLCLSYIQFRQSHKLYLKNKEIMEIQEMKIKKKYQQPNGITLKSLF